MLIEARHISKNFSGFALSDIDFTLDEGYIMGLAGRNGSGKTTLIRLLLGLYTNYSGDLFMFGRDYRNEAKAIKNDIGWVLHDKLFSGSRSLISNARHFGKYYSTYDESVLLELLGRFMINAKSRYGRLSKGGQLKFQIAFALSHKPKLLIMDEPAASFDPDFRKEFYALLNDFMKDGKHSVIISTHLLSELDVRADYLIYLKEGRMQYFGDMESFRDRIGRNNMHSIEEYMGEEIAL